MASSGDNNDNDNEVVNAHLADAKRIFIQIHNTVGAQNIINHTELLKQKNLILEMEELFHSLQPDGTEIEKSNGNSSCTNPPMNQDLFYEFELKKLAIENSNIFMNSEVVRLKVLLNRLMLHEVYESTNIDEVQDSLELRDTLQKISLYSNAFINEMKAAHSAIKAKDLQSIHVYKNLIANKLEEFPIDD